MKRLPLVAALLAALFFGWKYFSPPPDDREAIASELRAMRLAAKNGDVGGIVRRLDEGFKLGGSSKSEIRSQLTVFFYRSGAAEADVSNLNIQVEGDAATTSGDYTVRFRVGAGGSEDTRSGRFTARWRKANGAWRITEVEGADNLSR